LVRNSTIIPSATAEGTACSLFLITTGKKQEGMQQYVITVIDVASLTTGIVFSFYAGISALQKMSPAYI
jgi:general stress protein CsbA